MLRCMPSDSAGPLVERGGLIVYRLYDVADAIDVAAAARLLGPAHGRAGPRSAAFEAKPSVRVELGDAPDAWPGRACQVSARLFDFGAITIALRTELAGHSWADLLALSETAQEAGFLDEWLRRKLDSVVARAGGALKGPHPVAMTEDYTLFFLERLAGAPPASALLARGDLANLLLGEPASVRVSDNERAEVLAHTISYEVDDLAVIDWNAALVYEPSGIAEAPDLIELATAQLLELRYYDTLLDRELGRIYEEAASRRPRTLRSYSSLRASVIRTLLELTEFTERVENALKVTGDSYLARLYLKALESFRVPAWHASVQRKIGLVEQVYEILKGETDVARSLVLEILVAVLIVVELVVALRGGR